MTVNVFVPVWEHGCCSVALKKRSKAPPQRRRAAVCTCRDRNGLFVNNNLEYNPNSCLSNTDDLCYQNAELGCNFGAAQAFIIISHFFILVSLNLHEVVFNTCAINMKWINVTRMCASPSLVLNQSGSFDLEARRLTTGTSVTQQSSSWACC